MSKLRAAIVSIALLALAGCSGAQILNATIPRGGYTIHKDIAYGTEPLQKLDIYVPEKKNGCTVLFFYGGSWQTGSKDMYLFAGQAFASLGCVTAVADYRRYPAVSFPVFVEDSARAAVWVHNHIAAYGGDAGKLFLAGHSAGAYNAMMLATNTKFLHAAGGTSAWIKGVIGIAGPYDFLPMSDPKIIALFSTAKDTETQPVTFVHKGMPPVFLATGDRDTDVLPRNSIRLKAKLEKTGNKVELHTYPGIDHVGIITSLAPLFRARTTLLQDIGTFIRSRQGTTD